MIFKKKMEEKKKKRGDRENPHFAKANNTAYIYTTNPSAGNNTR
jgi:hypothetical protein